MAYEKLFNEIYAVVSLKYLWSEYRPGFIKSESPDWMNVSMGFGLEVSQALLPEDGQAASFLERYLGCVREDLPDMAFEHYGDRLYFYNDRFWAILPDAGEAQDFVYKAQYRFERKLEKLNRNYSVCRQNGLYLFLHPDNAADVDAPQLFASMGQRQAQEQRCFDLEFLNCTDAIYICNFADETMETIPVLESTRAFLTAETEELRHKREWENGTAL